MRGRRRHKRRCSQGGYEQRDRELHDSRRSKTLSDHSASLGRVSLGGEGAGLHLQTLFPPSRTERVTEENKTQFTNGHIEPHCCAFTSALPPATGSASATGATSSIPCKCCPIGCHALFHAHNCSYCGQAEQQTLPMRRAGHVCACTNGERRRECPGGRLELLSMWYKGQQGQITAGEPIWQALVGICQHRALASCTHNWQCLQRLKLPTKSWAGAIVQSGFRPGYGFGTILSAIWPRVEDSPDGVSAPMRPDTGPAGPSLAAASPPVNAGFHSNFACPHSSSVLQAPVQALHLAEEVLPLPPPPAYSQQCCP